MRHSALALLITLGLALPTAAPLAKDDGKATDQYWDPAFRIDKNNTAPKVSPGVGNSVGSHSPSTQQPAAERKEPVYFSRLIQDGGYKFAYNALLRYMGTQPTWLRRFHQSGDGVQFPAKKFDFKNRTYIIWRVCKPHDTETCWTALYREDDYVTWGYYSVGDAGEWIGNLPLDLAESVEKRMSNPNYWD